MITRSYYFYTGFPNYTTLKVYFDYLGPGVLQSAPETRGKSQLLTPMEKFFMILVRLRLGLLEKDLADCFGVSASTVSRICHT